MMPEGSRLEVFMDRADRALSWLETAFIGSALAFSAILLFVNVVLRYVFLASLGWAEEFAIFMVIWIVFVGASVAVRTQGHIAVELLPLLLSPANRRRLQMLMLTLMLVFLAVFFYYSAQHVIRVYSLNQLMPALRAPMWLAYLAMPVGSLLMFIRSTQLLIRVARSTSDDSVAPDVID